MQQFFFLSEFSFTDIEDSQDSRRRKRIIFYSTLPLPPAHEHWDIYLQLCMRDNYHAFLIVTFVFTRMLLDEFYHFIKLPFDWLIDWLIDWWCNVCLFTWWINFRCLLQPFDTGNRWIWTRIDYECRVHTCHRYQATDNDTIFTSMISVIQ